VAAAVRLPSSLGEYFDSAASPLNPRNVDRPFFVYGLLPITLTRLVAEPLGLAGYYDIYRVGRALSTLFDLGSVALVFLIGARLGGRRLGLLAALLTASAVLPIQLAHFYTVDSFGAFFVLLSLYWAVRIGAGGGWRSYAALGLSIGLAMAGGRVVNAALGLVGVVAALQGLLRELPRPLPSGLRPRLSWLARRLAGPLTLAGALALITFRIFQPDAFVGSRPGGPEPQGVIGPALLRGLGPLDVRPDPRYLANLAEIRGQASGEVDFPPSQQWIGNTGLAVVVRNTVRFGMGWPLGLLAGAGWAVAAWQIGRGRRLELLVPWLWATLLLLWQAGQFGIPMRYMLPAYGALILLAAWLGLGLWDWLGARLAAGPRSQRRLAQAGRWALAAALLATIGWAYAFTRIYARPHTRIAASHWLINNAPPGSVITSEHWDDALPLHVGGRNPWDTLRGLQLAPFAPDEPAKFLSPANPALPIEQQPAAGLIDQLAAADFVVLSSNRVYDALARQPARHPAMLRYYRALFSGDLGFDLAADIASYPSILGLAMPDYDAEESFTVYDHPRVLIFRKTERFSRERAADLITGGVNWGEVYRPTPNQANRALLALRLTPEEWPAYRYAPGASGASSLGTAAALLTWLLAVQLLGLAGFTLLFRLLPWLPDRGLSLARTLALLGLAYAAWLIASLRLAAFGPATWLCALALLAAGGWAGWRARAELLAFWRARRGAILLAEGLFLAAFAALAIVRALNPDLWHPVRGGEKPMDLAFLTAVVRSPTFPPYDPWYAGGYINYYYFGFVIVGALVQLSGAAPAVAYNLAVPTLFALAAVGAWGAIYNLLAPRPGADSRRRRTLEGQARRTGLLGVLFVLICGNLAQAIWLLPGTATPEAGGASGGLSYAAQQVARGRGEWAFWDASRIIPATINEFPFFTFLFADLHAHMIAIPLALAAVGLMVALARAGARGWAIVALLAPVTGALRAVNTWDYPTYTALALAALALPIWAELRRGSGPLGARAAPALRRYALQAGVLLGLGYLLFLPFHLRFTPEAAGPMLWEGARTQLWDWLRIYGLWLFLLISAGLLLARRLAPARQDSLIGVGAMLGVCLAGGLWLGLSALVLLLPLAAGLSLLLWWARGRSPRLLLPLLWAAAGLGLSALVELVTLRGDVGRMNTVFKFGLQAWTLWALTAALALPWLWRAARARAGWPAAAWRGAAGLLVGAALIYPIWATPARIADRDQAAGLPITLDGAAYLRYAKGVENGRSFPLAPDAAAIDWIRHNLAGSPVILEAHQPSYRWGGRIATYTGRPALLGWEWHEIQQRGAVNIRPPLTRRQEAIARIYGDADEAGAATLLRDYGVEYVVVGELERALYAEAGVAKFGRMAAGGLIERVYDREGTQIYRVLATRPDGILTGPSGVARPAPLGPAMLWPEQVALVSAPAGAPVAPASPAPAAPPIDLSELEAGVMASPADAGAAFRLAQAYAEAGRPADAAAVLAPAIAANPDDIPLYHLRGDMLVLAGQLDDAEAAYRAAAERAPGASTLTKLGAAQLAWGRLEDAETTLRQAIASDPAAPDAHYHLGVALLSLRQPDEARSELQRYFELAPDGRYSDDARRQLQAP
jgi:YYY domain-containing protein